MAMRGRREDGTSGDAGEEVQGKLVLASVRSSGCLNCGHATELTRMLTCKITEKFRSSSSRERMGKPNE